MKGYSFGELVKLAEAALPKTDNAVSATKLQTARTIGGVAFDGTRDINLPGVNTAGTQNTSGRAAVASTADKLTTARNINGVAFDGTKNIDISAGAVGTYTKAEIDAKDNLKLDKAGGTLTGVVSSNSNTIFNFSRDTNLNVGLDWSEDFLRFRAGSTEMAKGIRLSSYDTPVAEIRRNGNIWASSGMLVGSNRVFHEGFLPNAGQVGTYTKAEIDTKDNAKLNLTGGTLSGTLVMGGNEIHFTGSGNAAGDLVWKNGNTQEARIWSDSPTRLNISSGSSTNPTGTGVLSIDQNTLRFGGKKVYSEHEKPTADEVQAVRSLDGVNTYKHNYHNHYQSVVILLIPLSTSTSGSEASRRSVSGTLSLRRGHAGAANSVDVVEVHYQSAYNDLRGTYMKLHSSRGGRIVTCLYEGVRYLAWDVTSSGNAQDGDILFNGSIVGQDGNLLKTVAYKGDGTSGGTAVVTNKEVYDSLSAATAYNPMVGADGFIFHDHRPPSAAQVGTYTKAEIDQKDNGRLSLAGGTLTGGLTVDGGAGYTFFRVNRTEDSKTRQLEMTLSGGKAQLNYNDGAATSGLRMLAGQSFLYHYRGDTNYKIFTENNPPSAGQVGAYTKSEVDNIDKDLGEKVVRLTAPAGLPTDHYAPVAIYSPDVNLLINTAGGSSSAPMNTCSLRGRVRSAGWSDRVRSVDLDFTIYDPGERAIHSIWDGTENNFLCVVYVHQKAFPIEVTVPRGTRVETSGTSITYGISVFPAVATPANGMGTKISMSCDLKDGAGVYTREGKVFSSGKPPNADQVGTYTKAEIDQKDAGKLSLTGGTMTGTLSINRAGTLLENPALTGSAKQVVGVSGNSLYFGNSTLDQAFLETKSGGTISHRVGSNTYRIYTTGYKPTAADVGALASNGTAVAATKLATARTIGGTNFDGTANIEPMRIRYQDTRATEFTPATARTYLQVTFQNGNSNGVGAAAADYYNLLHIPQYNDSTGGYGSQIAFTKDGKMRHRRGISDTAWGSWNVLYSTGNKPTAADVGALASNGTAVAATKLATARSINGVNFDGTGNITITAAANGGTADKVNIKTSTLNAGVPVLVGWQNEVQDCSGKVVIHPTRGDLSIQGSYMGKGTGLTDVPTETTGYKAVTRVIGTTYTNSGNKMMAISAWTVGVGSDAYLQLFVNNTMVVYVRDDGSGGVLANLYGLIPPGAQYRLEGHSIDKCFEMQFS